ncbi:MAG: hypothetical protein ACRD2A_11050 [Vicinamibacterales bacterium]
MIVLILAPALAKGQSQRFGPDELTSGRVNGRAWGQLSVEERAAYLFGLESGLALSADLSGDYKTFADLTVKGFKFGDLANEVEVFYQDRSNLRIPITFAYVYVTKRIHGDSPQSLESYAAELRRRWNQ